jgi:hypothetical protein
MPEDNQDQSIDIDALATAFIAKMEKKTKGDSGEASLKAVAQLLKENREYRQKITGLTTEIDGLKGQVPAAGTVAVPEKEWKALTGLKEEGEKVDDFIQRVQRGAEAVTEVETLKRDSILREAAELVGYRFPVLRDRSQGLTVELDKEGEAERALVVTEEGKVELAEYAEKHWSDYMPALVSEERPPATRTFPRQPSGQRPPPASKVRPVEEIQKERLKSGRYQAF